MSSGEDITERRRAEEALRASERKFREVFDQSIQLTGLLALDGTVLEANRSALKLAGAAADDVIGKPYMETPWWNVLPEQQEQLKGAFKRAVGGEMAQVEVEHFDTRGGRHVVSALLSPFTDEGGNIVGVIPVGFDITDLKRAEQEVRASREQMRALATELSTAEERERRRIASNLHDQLGQALAVIRMKFGALTTASDREESAALIADIRDLLERAIEDTSTLTFDLSPPILYELGIEAAIEWIGEKVCGESELAFEFTDDGHAKPLTEDAKPLLYRCARELLMNVVKHSAATSVKVHIEREGSTIRLAVQDDGDGFDPAVIREHGEDGGFGLYSIQERMQYIGGRFGIESEPGKGTRAWICAPIKGATP
jgi:PAS domain S-box-containing protein